MLEFKYDTQLLIEGTDLDEDEINDYITEHFIEWFVSQNGGFYNVRIQI